MTGPVRNVLCAVLISALCLSTPATAALLAAGPAHLDPARVFSSEPASPLSLVQRTGETPLASALFDLPQKQFALDAAGVAAQPAVSPSRAVLHIARFEPSDLFGTESASLQLPAINPSAPLYADDRYDAPAPIDSLQIGLSATQLGAPVRFGAYQPYVPELQTPSTDLLVPLRIAGIRFTEEIQSSSMQTLQPDAFQTLASCGTTDAAAPCPYVNDGRVQSVIASTNFHLRAGNDILSLRFAGGVQQIHGGLDAGSIYAPVNPDPQFGPGYLGQSDVESPMLSYPGINAITKHGLDARLAVPVTGQITVGLQFDRQHYQGDYRSLFPALDARKDTYLGNVTYQWPHSSSAITFSARQYHYQDTFSPNYDLRQTRADLNFTVKF